MAGGRKMRIIDIANQKGGVGKTTTTLNLGASLAKQEYKTVIIDADAQCNLTKGIGFKGDDSINTIYECLTAELPLSKAIYETNFENLYIVPSCAKMYEIEQILIDVIGRETLLKESIEMCINELDYDFILIDSPPSLGIVSINCMVAAKEVIIPVEGAFAYDGLEKLFNNIQKVKRRLNPDLEILGALLNRYSATNFSNDLYEQLEKYFGDRVFKNVIRNSVRINESQAKGKPVIYYDSKCTSSEDYLSLVKEVIAYGN